jgi:esterase/lipase superfamily enzyme
MYWTEMNNTFRMLPDGSRAAVIYIHGYSNTLTDALVRAAQIGADLKVTGVMSAFCWPSKGNPLAYKADEAAVEASEEACLTYLREFANWSGAERVHVVAHSMGNRAFLRALQRILGCVSEEEPFRFGHFILAAPDVDADLFRQLAYLYRRFGKHTTLYACDGRDLALRASSFLHDYPRAGFSPPVLIVDALDTVHVGALDLTGLGHSYAAEMREVLTDIHQLLRFDAKPADRIGLAEARTAEGIYWKLLP